MSYDFESDWQNAKARFENATGKKKPGKKFLGAFRMSTGVEAACKLMTEAIESPSKDRIAKAEKAFEKAAADYLKVLNKAAKDEGEEDGERYNAELAKLSAAIALIHDDFIKAKQTETEELFNENDNIFTAFDKIIPKEIIEGLTKSKFPTTPAVLAFATKSEFAVSGADGKTKLPELAAAQQKAKDALKDYLKAAKAMKDQAKKSMERKEAWEFAGHQIDEAINALGSNGLRLAFGAWKNRQEQAFKDAGRSLDDYSKWLTSGLRLELHNSIQAETEHLNELGDICEKRAK